MSRKRKVPFLVELLGIAVRSYILWSARILIVAWYVYFVVHMDVRGGGYFVIAVALLSIFGLIQLIELIAVLVGLKDRTPQPEPDE
jgi:hypothetical protein